MAQEVPAPSAQDRAMLKTLRPGHPRLIGTAKALEHARRAIATDPLAKEWHARLKAEGDRILLESPVEHALIGPRLLDKSVRALSRVYTLALLYRLDGDRRYFERARRELLTVCAFPDWNPSHFLDVAEMTHAAAIGYDWLYPDLSAEDRAVIRRAIVELGLRPAAAAYRNRAWWIAVNHNWNQVCNGGITIGALAVADEEPDLAAYIVGNAVRNLPKAMESYAPDGGWAEGPGYWTYATVYNVYLLAALESALGTDFGLSKAKGFAQTALFRLQFEGPDGLLFNFADANDRAGATPALFWLAQRFRQPTAAWLERREVTTPHALDLLWFQPAGPSPDAAKQPLDAYYKGINAAFFRSSWTDPKATSLAFKGGDNKANHSHLDLGTFVLDALGRRWAVDLGRDDYNLPGYFGKQRYTYYRLKTEGHNTLTVDGANQPSKAKAPIVAFSSRPERAFAVADLSQAYGGKALRGVALLNRRDALIQDEVTLKEPAETLWTMHTPGEILVDGPHASLKLGGAVLYATILSPAGARFESLPTLERAEERHNQGIRRLAVRVAAATTVRIAILLSPSATASAEVTPLDRW
jgi:hypothetical protein